MTDKQKAQTLHYLETFVDLANNFFNEGDMVNNNYWKGQVMGISKMCNLLNLGIDTDYYLKQMA